MTFSMETNHSDQFLRYWFSLWPFPRLAIKHPLYWVAMFLQLTFILNLINFLLNFDIHLWFFWMIVWILWTLTYLNWWHELNLPGFPISSKWTNLNWWFMVGIYFAKFTIFSLYYIILCCLITCLSLKIRSPFCLRKTQCGACEQC